MSRPNFIVKVPSIQLRHRPRPRRSKKKIKTSKADNYAELETIVEANNCDTKNSSYYSLNEFDSSEVKLKVIETYDEFLNLRDLDKIYWKSPSDGLNSTDQSDEGIFWLKQICADMNLDMAQSEKEYQVLPVLQTDNVKIPQHELRTAIIAQRILDTQEQIANSRKNSGTGFSGDSLRRSPFNKSVRSLGRIDETPRTCSLLSKTLSNLTSKFIIKPKTPTIASEVQVNLVGRILPVLSHSCNTQTEQPSCEDILKSFFKNHQCRRTMNQYVQSPSVQHEDKFVNTTSSSLYPNREQATQMYEHITENDLLCMEWIDKNLFRVPVNPNTVIVDEKLRDTSEFTCMGTNFFEQELNWEMEALC